MNQGIVPADKRFRKRIILFLVFVTIALIVIGPYFEGYLDQIDQQSQKNPEIAFREMMSVFKSSMGVVSLLLLGMGVYLFLLARWTSKSGQYPPPGMKVIRDTRVRTGHEAKSITILMVTSSVILILFALLFLCFPWALEKILTKKKNPQIEGNTGIEQKVFTERDQMRLDRWVPIVTGAGRGVGRASLPSRCQKKESFRLFDDAIPGENGIEIRYGKWGCRG